MIAPSWYLDELAHAGREHLDPEYVASYDAKTGLEIQPDVALLRELGMDERSTVVDLGAGTGILSAAVAPAMRERKEILGLRPAAFMPRKSAATVETAT